MFHFIALSVHNAVHVLHRSTAEDMVRVVITTQQRKTPGLDVSPAEKGIARTHGRVQNQDEFK